MYSEFSLVLMCREELEERNWRRGRELKKIHSKKWLSSSYALGYT